MKRRLISVFATLLLVIALVPLVPAAAAPGDLDHVVISPISTNVTVGTTQQFTAQGQDSSNVTIPDLTYAWAVVNGGGTIDNNGLFTASNVTGTFTNTVKVIASQGSTNVTAYASVIVSPVPPVLDHVVISPTSTNIAVNTTQQFTAQGQTSGNATIPDLTYAWAVVNGGGTIDNNGLFTAGNVTGTFTNTVKVIASQGSTNVTAYASVIVSPVPPVLDHVVVSPTSTNIAVNTTQQFTAQGQTSGNATIPDLTYAWAVVNGGGTIDNNGLFTAGNVTGTFTNTVKVIASQGSTNVTAYASVIVSPVPVPPEEDTGKVPPGWSKGNKNGWGGQSTPPGWSKGNKTGWNNGMPPGLAKGHKSK